MVTGRQKLMKSLHGMIMYVYVMLFLQILSSRSYQQIPAPVIFVVYLPDYWWYYKNIYLILFEFQRFVISQLSFHVRNMNNLR